MEKGSIGLRNHSLFSKQSRCMEKSTVKNQTTSPNRYLKLIQNELYGQPAKRHQRVVSKKRLVLCKELRESATAVELQQKIKDCRRKTRPIKDVSGDETSGCHKISRWILNMEKKKGQETMVSLYKVFLEKLKGFENIESPKKSTQSSIKDVSSIFDQSASHKKSVQMIIGSNQAGKWDDSLLGLLD